MNKLSLFIMAAFIACTAMAEVVMEQKSLIPRNAVVVTGAERTQIPTDEIFAKQGKFVTLDAALPWNLLNLTGEKSANAILLRFEVEAPQDGWYRIQGGADWWLSAWVDGVLRLQCIGDCPPSLADHEELVELKAGKHLVDVNFARGDGASLLALGLFYAGSHPDFGVDFTRKEGKLNRDLHGSNTTLILSTRALIKYDEELRKLHFSLSRTHDWALWNQGQRIIDTHFIFPLLKLDPQDPSNYYFDATDEIIRLTQDEAKMEVFYRLGTSIEHTGAKHFNAVPPEDFDHYAEVMAGIVRHYTHGWANGFHYNIRYWEIWNEPDGPRNEWDAPYETFIPLFVKVLKRLKSEFPELQFGGPAMCGPDRAKFQKLLAACKEAGIAPDFISWHSYTLDEKSLIAQPVKMRKFLDELGFPETKLCLDEWHYVESWQGLQSYGNAEEYRKGHEQLYGIRSGIFNVAVLSAWQYGPLDLAMWYGSSWDSDAWGYRDLYKNYTKNYYSMQMVGEFLTEYTEKVHAANLNGVYLAAGTNADGSQAGILVADLNSGLEELGIPVKGIEAYKVVSAVVLDKTRDLEPVEVKVKDGALVLPKQGKGEAAFSIRLERR